MRWAWIWLLLPQLAFGPAPPAARLEDGGGVSVRPLRVVPPSRVRISGGRFLAGSTGADLASARASCAGSSTPDVASACEFMVQLEITPQRVRWLSAFAIDRTEVTQEAYARCVRAGSCTPSHLGPGATYGPRLPISGVDHDQARAYCAFAGGALPTEAQWERAARGPGGRIYPWGWAFNSSLANHGALLRAPAAGSIERASDAADGFSRAAPVGSYPQGASPDGVLDMAGNVREWVDDALPAVVRDDPWTDRVDPRGPVEGSLFVVRGGGFRSAPFQLRTTSRWAQRAAYVASDLGFRCAYPVDP